MVAPTSSQNLVHPVPFWGIRKIAYKPINNNINIKVIKWHHIHGDMYTDTDNRGKTQTTGGTHMDTNIGTRRHTTQIDTHACMHTHKHNTYRQTDRHRQHIHTAIFSPLRYQLSWHLEQYGECRLTWSDARPSVPLHSEHTHYLLSLWYHVSLNI